MKIIAFSIHDSKAAAFIQPFFCPTVAVGIRSYQQAANDPDTMFARFPGDYTLFEIGTFDQETGTLEQLEHPINHGLALIHQVSEKTPSSHLHSVGDSDV